MHQHSELRSRPPVDRVNIQSIHNWLSHYPGLLKDEEAQYIHDEEDLIALAQPEVKTPLIKLAESLRLDRCRGFVRREELEGRLSYRHERRFSAFAWGVAILFGLLMLVAPLWIMSRVKGMTARLTIITAFVVAFVPVVAFVSVARPFETLVATAGYVTFTSIAFSG